MDFELEARKIRRSETSLEAARRNAAARTEIVRITGEEVEAKTSNLSALKDAQQAKLADDKAQLFYAVMQRAIAQAELARTAGRL
ncbi:MAG TPA: hypothetical protein VGM27_34195 [Acidobacteriaceae bacterium]|jgi:hypothetical protein